MELTYGQARDTVLDHTEMGYTIASQDRLWTVFIYDLWSEDDFKFNRLYSSGIGQPWSYEMWEHELMWTSRAEAEAFAEKMRDRFAEHPYERAEEGVEVYVINWGDDARHEATRIGRYGVQPRTAPKFKGSQKAWDAMTAMQNRWMEEHG